MRPDLPMALLLLNPLLVEANEVPRDFLPGIVLDEPLPTRFKTGQALSLSGSVEDSTISFVRFAFLGADGLQLDFWGWVVEGRFGGGKSSFPTAWRDNFDLVVDAQEETEDFASLGRFDGLQIDRGTGPVMLPRRYFPLVHLDQPLPTDLATGEALHVAGTLEGTSTPAHILPPEEDPVGTGGYSYLDIQGGVEPVRDPLAVLQWAAAGPAPAGAMAAAQARRPGR